jgi:hypothetical protein
MFNIAVEVEGCEFGFLAGWEPDGIVIPSDAPIDNPSFIAALREARQVYKYYYAYFMLLSGGGVDFISAIYHVGIDSKSDVWNYIELMLEAFDKGYLLQYREQFFDWHKNFITKLDAERAREQKKDAKLAKRAANAKGHVYLLAATTGDYKIGRSKNPPSRAKQIGVKMPFGVELIHVIHTDDMRKLESELHTRFAEKHVNGEWFSLSPEDVTYIKGL